MINIHVNDPGHVALRRAGRVAIVFPVAFAIGNYAVGDTSTALYCAFGSFGLLSLTDFGGRRKRRLLYYCILGVVSVVNISFATLCSQVLAVSIASMAVAAFVMLFAGLINAYVVAMTSAMLLMYVLPVTVPGDIDTIPYRLAGFGIAWALSVPAALFLWPYFSRNVFRPKAAQACEALAGVLEALPVGSAVSPAAGEEAARRFQALRDVLSALRQQWLATPFRPTGTTEAERAVARLMNELDWLYGLLAPPIGHPDAPPVLYGHVRTREDAAVVGACAVLLQDCGAALIELRHAPRPQRVAESAEAALLSLERQLPNLAVPDHPVDHQAQSTEWLTALAPSFRLRALTYTTASLAADVAVAIGDREAAPPDPRQADSPRLWRQVIEATTPALSGTWDSLRRYLTPRSVWFRNSVRGAVALAGAVAVAGGFDLQHGFWVVLAALTVLRTKASGTQATALRAVAGTLLGFVIGAAIVYPDWADGDFLWAVWPITIFFAAWGGTISLILGQAAFTVMVVILFNLLGEGWRVAVVRIEDVLIGCAVAVGAGFLFWPHGAGAALADRLAAAYRSSVALLAAVLRGAARRADLANSLAAPRRAALADSALLDDAVRQYLSEHGTLRLSKEDLVTLIGGASRVRMIAHSLLDAVRANTAELVDGFDWQQVSALGAYEDLLSRDLTAVQAWYAALSDALSSGGQVLPPYALDMSAHGCILGELRDAAAADKRVIRPALTLVLVGQHLDYLARLEGRLEPAAERVAGWRRVAWWR